MPEEERATVLELVRAAVRALGLRDEQRAPAAPRVYDYDEYEKDALGILLYSGYGYGVLPPESQQEQERAWSEECSRVGERIESGAPGVYAVTGYGVEG